MPNTLSGHYELDFLVNADSLQLQKYLVNESGQSHQSWQEGQKGKMTSQYQD